MTAKEMILKWLGYWKHDDNWLRPDGLLAGGTGIRPAFDMNFFREVLLRLREKSVNMGVYFEYDEDGKCKVEIEISRYQGQPKAAIEESEWLDTPEAALEAALEKLLGDSEKEGN